MNRILKNTKLILVVIDLIGKLRLDKMIQRTIVSAFT